jgi:hypothetical protein
LRDSERAERRHERRDPQIRDQSAIEQACDQPYSHGDRESHNKRARPDRCQRQRNRAKRQHGADREIEPFCQNHEGHREREQQQNARLQ